MDDFFTTFPKLKQFLDRNAEEGMSTNRIIGAPPTNRIRFYHPPENDGEKQAIARQSRNYQLQEANASMLKIALIKLRRYILDNNFNAQLHIPVHDEIVSSCPSNVSEQWAKIQAQAMQEAADMFVEQGLLKTDTKITSKWTK